MFSEFVDADHGYDTAPADDAGIDPDRIERLADRARREVDDGLLPSCQFAIARHGRLVATRTYGARPTARYVTFSCTKAISAGAIWRILDTTSVTRDTPAAELVDGFGTAGKDAVTVEHLLTHTAGFPHARMEAEEWVDPARRRARFSSWALEWEPGSQFAYHPTAAHWVLAALAESATGRDFRQFVRDEVLGPLGLDALQLGTPIEDQADVLDVVPVGTPPDAADLRAIANTSGLDVAAVAVVDRDVLMHNDPDVRAVGQPAGGAIGRAADLALYYQALLANPHGRWQPDTLRAGTADILCTHTDPIIGVPANRSLGLVVAGADGAAFMRGFGTETSARAFGHMGAGGQVAWADPDSGLSFAYLTNGIDRDLLRMGMRSNELGTLAGTLAHPPH